MRKVRVLINPKSGVSHMLGAVERALAQYWDVPGVDLTFQISRDPEDGQAKARRAVAEGADTVLVVGGDGMVNTIGRALVGTPVALGVLPAGSGNGLARHFGVPLNPRDAARVLAQAPRKPIDVGRANGRPFFVTCSMAWDAALVRGFEKSPIRGILPYVFAAAYEFIGYVPQPVALTLDGQERLESADPLVLTVANMTQYGGGAMIAPQAQPDDGFLELIVISRQDAPLILANLPRLFDGTFHELPGVMTRRFRQLRVHRRLAGPMQCDGELVDAPPEIEVSLQPRALYILAPEKCEAP